MVDTVALNDVLRGVCMLLLLLAPLRLPVVAKDAMTSSTVAIVTDPLCSVADQPPRLHLEMRKENSAVKKRNAVFKKFVEIDRYITRTMKRVQRK